jgi:molybdate transport system ATP-binding protein
MRLHIDDIALRLGDMKFHFDAEIDNGITGIFGPSGAGKTTLMKILAGIETAESGRLVFNGEVLIDAKKKLHIPPHRRNMGVVFQEHYLFNHLTVEKNLRYSEPYIKRRTKNIDFESVVRLLNLEGLLSKMPAELSGGERQRTAIGRALLSQPAMLLMDEPFSNLDRDRRKQIISYLLEVNFRFEIPLLIISHDLEDILKLTKSFLIVDEGCIRATGHYLDIADSGAAPRLISHKRYINVIELMHSRTEGEGPLSVFSQEGEKESAPLIADGSHLATPSTPGRRVRLAILPDDVALSRQVVPEISIQNQLLGKITSFREYQAACFVSVDCGFELTAEITHASKERMRLEVGQDIYCLIKAKAVEIVHVYGE